MKNKLMIWGAFATLLLFCVPVTALANEFTPSATDLGFVL